MAEYVQVINRVNTSKIRVELDDKHDEIMIIPSYTMPDDVVMNGVMYPAEEIEKSYKGLEGAPAPIGHPHDANGNYVSASSEIGVNRFMHGVFNGTVERVDGRIYVEKRVNVTVANRTDEGKRLVDTIRKIIAGESDEPIHTSTGVFIKPQMLDKPVMNEKGKEYHTIARDLIWDHDAILLDEEGAATPLDGVGMLVNKSESTHVMRVNLSDYQQKVDSTGSTSYHDKELNTNNGDNMALRDRLCGFLKANKVDVAEDASDATLLDHLEAMRTNKELDKPIDVDKLLANSVSEALKPITEKLDSMEARFNAMDEAKKKELMDRLKKNGYSEEEITNMSDDDMEKAKDAPKEVKANAAEYTAPVFKPNTSAEKFTTDLDAWGK